MKKCSHQWAVTSECPRCLREENDALLKLLARAESERAQAQRELSQIKSLPLAIRHRDLARMMARRFARLAVHGMIAPGDPIEVEPGRLLPRLFPAGSIEVTEYAHALAHRAGLDVGAGPLTLAEQEP